ncbi:C-type lectin domain-containing protein [Caenorhabditis elegans]|uniref:C-type lectin domain-containing protein n=1 Tax=Caenorhabditis elegans TaxID=6239 RepID=Q9XWF3_CAEEL|nr:C-type lectin domain-containing protein [Caenorhabditis elegans]CAA21719.1 C-type lectin domain-containing protein [Caenorhabditis elegans]|eukprot:NP_492857.1 C-type LECtin [Caenorhabditis elegans]
MELQIFLIFTLIGLVIAYTDYYGGGKGRPPPARPPPPPPPRGVKCPAGWTLWKRSQGNWCIRVFHGQYTNPQAEAQCHAKGATLTGLQTAAERNSLAKLGYNLIHQHKYGDAAIWLGARRKGSCPRAGICSPRDTFFWTDKHTRGTAGFVFSPGQPDGITDGYNGPWGVQSCVHQFVFPSGSTHPRWPGIPHGALDDQYCQEGKKNPFTKFYACGRKAT